MYFLVRMVTEPSTMVLATSLQKYTMDGVAQGLRQEKICLHGELERGQCERLNKTARSLVVDSDMCSKVPGGH